MTARPTKCIFCGGGPVTKEHIYSRWTHRYIPATMTKYQSLRATAYPDRSDYKIVKRPGDIRDWQVKCVCEKRCNNGWMRKLVDEPAIPIMTPLITGQSVRVTPDDQQIVAAWAAMKAMIAEYDDGGYVTTHHKQRKRMMERQLPPEIGWGIWIGSFRRREWVPYWSSHPFLVLPDDRVIKRTNHLATYFNGHSSTQVVGQLFIQIIRSPMRIIPEAWKFSLPDGGFLARVWPPSPYSITWPLKGMTDRDADYAAAAFKEFLMELRRKRGP